MALLAVSFSRTMFHVVIYWNHMYINSCFA